jgi:hypothetical protein
MTVSPEERFHQRQPRYSKEEFAQRGDALYDSQIRLPLGAATPTQVEEGNHGKIVAITYGRLRQRY